MIYGSRERLGAKGSKAGGFVIFGVLKLALLRIKSISMKCKYITILNICNKK
jgi:hypothetical protein